MWERECICIMSEKVCVQNSLDALVQKKYFPDYQKGDFFLQRVVTIICGTVSLSPPPSRACTTHPAGIPKRRPITPCAPGFLLFFPVFPFGSAEMKVRRCKGLRHSNRVFPFFPLFRLLSVGLSHLGVQLPGTMAGTTWLLLLSRYTTDVPLFRQLLQRLLHLPMGVAALEDALTADFLGDH